MEPVFCVVCSTYFTPRNKSQNFCSHPDCQRARKRLWQKEKMATDPDYRSEQRLAQKKWLLNNPNYWKDYRRKNKEQADRNRCLQKIRNMKNRKRFTSEPSEVVGIAKMDASKSRDDVFSGQYWLIPTVAKMDPVKIFIATISKHYK